MDLPEQIELMKQAEQAFTRAEPRLLQEGHEGEWVVFSGPAQFVWEQPKQKHCKRHMRLDVLMKNCG